MKLIHLIIASLCVTVSMQAQQKEEKDTASLSRELILEKEYNPSVKDAFKINALPEIKEPAAPKAKIEYSNFTIPYDIKPEISLLDANSYFTQLDHSKKRGYANLGIGSFIDVNADLGYQILNTDANRLNIMGSHRSSNGDVDYLQSNESQEMKINDNMIGLNYNGNSGFLKYFADASYTYSTYNYYGYTLLPPPDIEPSYVNKDNNQVSNIFDLSMGLGSDEPKEDLNYSFKAGYSYFGDKYATYEMLSGPKEHNYKLEMDLHKGMDADKLIGFRGFFSGNSYSIDNNTATQNSTTYYDYEDYMDVGLNPYFDIEGDKWSAHLGVMVDLLFHQNENINIAPDITFNYRPKENVLVYLNAKGGVDDNTNRDIYRENRYVSPLHRVQNTYSSFDGILGIKAAFGNFWFDFFGGYKYAKQNYFYTQNVDYNTAVNYDSGYLGANFAVPEYYDGGVFQIGTDWKYKYTDNFEIGLKSVYYNWNLKENESTQGNDVTSTPWNQPDLITDISMSYKLTQIPLRFDLTYHLETGRKAYSSALMYNPMSSLAVWSSPSNIIDMDNISQLNVQGTYTFNDIFSIFARANNLLFKEYDLWYGYAAQGFNVMGGINIKF